MSDDKDLYCNPQSNIFLQSRLQKQRPKSPKPHKKGLFSRKPAPLPKPDVKTRKKTPPKSANEELGQLFKSGMTRPSELGKGTPVNVVQAEEKNEEAVVDFRAHLRHVSPPPRGENHHNETVAEGVTAGKLKGPTTDASENLDETDQQIAAESTETQKIMSPPEEKNEEAIVDFRAHLRHVSPPPRRENYHKEIVAEGVTAGKLNKEPTTDASENLDEADQEIAAESTETQRIMSPPVPRRTSKLSRPNLARELLSEAGEPSDNKTEDDTSSSFLPTVPPDLPITSDSQSKPVEENVIGIKEQVENEVHDLPVPEMECTFELPPPPLPIPQPKFQPEAKKTPIRVPLQPLSKPPPIPIHSFPFPIANRPLPDDICTDDIYTDDIYTDDVYTDEIDEPAIPSTTPELPDIDDELYTDSDYPVEVPSSIPPRHPESVTMPPVPTSAPPAALPSRAPTIPAPIRAPPIVTPDSGYHGVVSHRELEPDEDEELYADEVGNYPSYPEEDEELYTDEIDEYPCFKQTKTASPAVPASPPTIPPYNPDEEGEEEIYEDADFQVVNVEKEEEYRPELEGMDDDIYDDIGNYNVGSVTPQPSPKVSRLPASVAPSVPAGPSLPPPPLLPTTAPPGAPPTSSRDASLQRKQKAGFFGLFKKKKGSPFVAGEEPVLALPGEKPKEEQKEGVGQQQQEEEEEETYMDGEDYEDDEAIYEEQ